MRRLHCRNARVLNYFTRSVYFLISTYQVSSAWLEMQSAQRKKVKVWYLDRGLNPGPSTCQAEALTLSYRHLCTICAVLSIYYWISDIHVWDVTHLVMAEQPHYRSYILVLISTYQVSSAWLECRALQGKIVKVFVCRPGIEPGTSRFPGKCSNRLSYRHLVLSCAVLSIYYWITDIHVWDVMHLVMTEQPHYRSFI